MPTVIDSRLPYKGPAKELQGLDKVCCLLLEYIYDMMELVDMHTHLLPTE
jgi:hypothetical protein